MTVQDLVIEDLATGEAAAIEQVCDLHHEIAVWRQMFSLCLEELVRATSQLTTARRTLSAMKLAQRRHTSTSTGATK